MLGIVETIERHDALDAVRILHSLPIQETLELRSGFEFLFQLGMSAIFVRFDGEPQVGLLCAASSKGGCGVV